MTEAIFFNGLRKQLSGETPFVVYRKPGEKDVRAFLQKDDRLYRTTDFKESGFIFAAFDDQRPAFLIPEGASEKIIFEISDISEVSEKGINHKAKPDGKQKEEHVRLVKKAISVLRSGELEKVVLSRKEEVNLEEKDPLHFFSDILRAYPTAFVYLWFHPETGLWLGASPEVLLKVEGNRFRTMALAGTQKYQDTMEVEWGEKEKQEQKFVTDEILTRLKPLVSEMGSSEVYTARAGNLLHLRTDIRGQLANSVSRFSGGTEQLIKALHPTPAVCGLPKEQAREFILKEEPHDREFYTGFLGELNLQQVTQRSHGRRNVENLAYRTVKKETALFVNLRCMKLTDGKAILYIGGGITKDSEPEAEWQETVNKAQTMKKVLLK